MAGAKMRFCPPPPNAFLPLPNRAAGSAPGWFHGNDGNDLTVDTEIQYPDSSKYRPSLPRLVAVSYVIISFIILENKFDFAGSYVSSMFEFSLHPGVSY